MNSSLATLAIFLVAAMFLSQAQAQFDTKLCCFAYTRKPFPLRNLKSYEHSHAMCALQAVILITKEEGRLCVDPKAQWVQERMKRLSQN